MSRIKIRVYTKEDEVGGYNGTVLEYLRPRAYMTSYSFQQLLKYTRHELECYNIDESEVIGFEIYEKGYWTDYIRKE